MIPVTRPFLPPIEEYSQYLTAIWKRQWLTNMGPLSTELENSLKKHLGVQQLLYVTNGTVALQMAIKALQLKGEVITTPFSFVATTSSIVWEGCEPVFVDIDSTSLNIDPDRIEEAITERTTGIIATHVYGNPCDVNKIDTIAKKHGLKVIYDAAHAFDVKINGKSVFEFGDISTCSLHATKLFHSGEGGLIISNNEDLLHQLGYLRNFGFKTTESFAALGINGKNSEFHAAMGLTNLKYLEVIHTQRKRLSNRYKENLELLDINYPVWHKDSNENYAYFPVIFKSHELAMKVLELLKINDVHARRYFFPSLASSLPYLPEVNMPVTEDIAKRILCLPLYYDLSIEEVDFVCNIIKKVK